MVTLWGEVVIRSVGYVLYSLHVCVWGCVIYDNCVCVGGFLLFLADFAIFSRFVN